ncbi:MAG: hypothetical protein AMS27_06910 [Bacteroides sp. SM23_62_1]|nr:MAG: hypothetical protein AMS27_06910 [Bacteroides sp. SM23_62_1]
MKALADNRRFPPRFPRSVLLEQLVIKPVLYILRNLSFICGIPAYRLAGARNSIPNSIHSTLFTLFFFVSFSLL